MNYNHSVLPTSSSRPRAGIQKVTFLKLSLFPKAGAPFACDGPQRAAPKPRSLEAAPRLQACESTRGSRCWGQGAGSCCVCCRQARGPASSYVGDESTGRGSQCGLRGVGSGVSSFPLPQRGKSLRSRNLLGCSSSSLPPSSFTFSLFPPSPPTKFPLKCAGRDGRVRPRLPPSPPPPRVRTLSLSGPLLPGPPGTPTRSMWPPSVSLGVPGPRRDWASTFPSANPRPGAPRLGAGGGGAGRG
jgi:hypothetical protein